MLEPEIAINRMGDVQQGSVRYQGSSYERCQSSALTPKGLDPAHSWPIR